MKRKLLVSFLIFIIALAASYLVINRRSPSLPPGIQADMIVVNKSERTLSLLSNGAILKTYRISLGRQPVGKKVKQGDNRTPEGTYRIVSRNPKSGYHLSLRISYPNADDTANAQDMGVNPGGDIMIHGIRNGFGWLGKAHLLMDWTQGCIAVTNPEIEEIWRAVPDETTIRIAP